MELRDLSYFEVIAELQSVSAAAARLHRTQPALTASVRRLEEFCDAPLLERSGRGIRLTSAGEVLLEWARRLRLDAQDARRAVADFGLGLSGNIRLGVVPTAAQYLLPDALKRLLIEAPQVTVSTTIGLRSGLIEKLRAGELDVIVTSEHQSQEEFDFCRLGEDQIVVVANNGHPLLTRTRESEPISINDLVRYGWILQELGSPTRDWIEHVFDRLGLPRPSVRIESDMLLMLPALMAGTELLGFVSRLHLRQTATASYLREIPVEGINMRRYFVSTWRKSAYLPSASRRLISLLKQADIIPNSEYQ